MQLVSARRKMSFFPAIFWLLVLCVFSVNAASLRSSEEDKKNVAVIIIGGGASGLAAAQKLHDLKFTNVKILEALSNTGGRVQTKPFGATEGDFVEWGAEQIHGTDQPFYDFAKEQGHVVDFPYHDDGYHLQNGVLLPEADGKLFDAAFHEFHRINEFIMEQDNVLPDPLQNLSVEANRGFMFLNGFHSRTTDQATSRLNMLAYDYAVRLEMLETSCPTPYKSLSHRYYTDYTQIGDNFLLHPKISYENVLKGMSSTFPREWIKTDMPVEQIRLVGTTPGSRVSVRDRSGTVHVADHVITTVSVGVLQASPSLFEPILPEKKRDAIAKWGFGNVAKIFLEFPTPFWEDLAPKGSRNFALVWTEEMMNIPYSPDTVLYPNQATPKWFRHAVHWGPVPSSPSTILVWVAGPGAYAVDNLGDDEVKKDCHELLQQFIGSAVTVPEPTKITRATWSTNPFIRGTYSYFSLASSQAKLSPVDLAEPLWEYPKIHNGGDKAHSLLFAGEASHSTYFSTVPGAIMAGRREAERIGQYYTDPVESTVTITVPSSTTSGSLVSAEKLSHFSLILTVTVAMFFRPETGLKLFWTVCY